MSTAQREASRDATRRYRARKRLGIVVAVPTLAERFWSKVDKSGQCWLWTGAIDASGYGKFYLDGVMVTAHRAGWLISGHQIPAGQVVRHFICDNPPCVNPDHLLVGTDAENAADKVAHGRQRKGERMPMAKLTDEAVRAIRARHAAGDRQIDLAAEYGITEGTIWPLLRRRTWRHVR